LTDKASKAFGSYMAAYNVKGYLLRKGGDIPGSARLGAAPWQLGMLSAMLCIFDIFTGRHDGTPEYRDKLLQVQAEHVRRGYSLLNVVHLLRARRGCELLLNEMPLCGWN
jgi:hypothetical protein